MTRRSDITSCLVALVLLTRVVRADAPVSQYRAFGASDVVINDVFTDLEWDREASEELTDTPSDDRCSNATPPKRRPTVRELLSIVDEVRHKEQVAGKPVDLAVDGPAFGGKFATRGLFWTSTKGNMAGFRLLVDLQTGEVSTAVDTNVKARVRCVRYLP
jgi:hypothetical protein